mmetsp:Transcript_39651/g.45145  ORF Transcript_39651/g.45145 Transcript_39651/m.45145 type:complete len:224 (+) Transcript_39651:513-1184(+)
MIPGGGDSVRFSHLNSGTGDISELDVIGSFAFTIEQHSQAFFQNSDSISLFNIRIPVIFNNSFDKVVSQTGNYKVSFVVGAMIVSQSEEFVSIFTDTSNHTRTPERVHLVSLFVTHSCQQIVIIPGRVLVSIMMSPIFQFGLLQFSDDSLQITVLTSGAHNDVLSDREDSLQGLKSLHGTIAHLTISSNQNAILVLEANDGSTHMERTGGVRSRVNLTFGGQY